MNIEECLKEGLLTRTKPDKPKAKASLEMAEHKLEIAEKELEHKIFESAIISAYAAMFHAARALLFRDGYKERSHFAVSVFVTERYAKTIERRFLSELNALRMQRHELTYDLEKSQELQESETESAISAAKGFLKTVKKAIEKTQ